jgi:hypothetical protein
VVSAAKQISPEQFGKPAIQEYFQSESYQIAQPFFQIFKEGYDIVSADQRESFQAVRLRSHFKNLVATAGAWIAATAAVVAMSLALTFVGSKLGGSVGVKVLFMGTLSFIGVAIVIATYIVVLRALAPKRKVTLFLKADATREILTIQPTAGIFFFNPEYEIRDEQGAHLATFKKDFIESIFRKHWHCFDSRGKYLFSAIEDSLFMALMRRFMFFGKFIPLQFGFSKRGGKKFGEFRRRYSLKDKYSLNFASGAAESWLMVATALLLDTGEER